MRKLSRRLNAADEDGVTLVIVVIFFGAALFLFAALFLALLVLQINSRRAVVAALVGGTIAFVLVPFTAPGVPIIAATAGCLVGWRRR